jgi:predicted dehydrogenase
VDRTGLTFLVGQTMRFGVEFAEAKRMFDAGELGEIIFAEAHYVHDARTFFPLTPWRQRMPQDLMYGGASHPIDLLRWFLGGGRGACYGRKSGLIRITRTRMLPDQPRQRRGRGSWAYGLVHPPMPMMGLNFRHHASLMGSPIRSRASGVN